jgi:urease subunit gamma/beta
MRLTAWEEERLLIFGAAELARRHRDRGLQLNHPEAVALICDAMLEAARGGASYDDVIVAGREAVAPGDLLPGVAALVDEVRLEVLFGDGARLVVLVDPFGAATAEDAPGAIATPAGTPRDTAGPEPAPPSVDRERRSIEVHNTSRRVVRVSSHYPFDRVNPRLVFDRAAAAGFRLDLPAGATERWSPGETRTVGLIRRSGSGRS